MEREKESMSSALKKKRRFNPKGYEDRGKMQQIQKNKTLSEKCFTELFDSMQLINFTVLYAPTEDGGFESFSGGTVGQRTRESCRMVINAIQGR